MTAGEALTDLWSSVYSHFSGLTTAEALTNAGFTALVVVLAFVAQFLAKRAIRWIGHHLPGAASAEKVVRTSRISRLLQALAGVAATIVAIVLVCGIWGFDALSLLTAGPWAPAAGALVRLVLIALAAVIGMEVAGYIISHALSRIDPGEAQPRRRAQLKTLGPLLTGVAQSTIVVVAALMALGEIGISIGPLLAGAGVVGIALGFGAQSLVKDLLTGVFLIVEDIVSVGDIIRIGESGGLVERMTLRTIRLRDFDGTLHVFPYGEAQVVHNLTKTFSYYVFDLQVSYGSDIDQALRVMRQVGDRMQADPEFADKILEPIEVVGVDNLADSGVVLKARIKTQPIQQWTVGREYNRRIKLAFDEAGIEIPFPHMKVVLPERQLEELAAH